MGNSFNIIQNEPNMFLLTIFVGIITFSIPFLWNAYQNILEKKKYITGEKIENILTKEFYQKSVKYFEWFLQIPAGLLIFLGLFFIPFLSLELGFIVSITIFLYFLFLPQIFQKIEEKSSTSLKEFLSYKDAELSDLQKAFLELWQKDDQNIEKEFSIKPLHVFEYFVQKIDLLLRTERLSIAKEYLNNYLTFINNRSIIFLVVFKEVFPKILEWHFEIWKKEYEYLSKDDKSNERGNYSEILRVLDSIFSKIEERSLKEREGFSFFECFKKHAEKYKKEFVTGKENKKYYYIESLFGIFYQVFFKNIENSPERYDIWEHYFPQEWKVTKTNLEDKEKIISRVSRYNFLQWAQERIWQAKEEFDRNLDDVSHNLFPEVEPVFWARILTFVFSPYGENRVESVIKRPWNFGFVGRIKTYSGYSENNEEFRKKMSEKMQSEEKTETKNTLELTNLLFPQQFSKENLEKYISDLKGLKYEKESKEEGKRLRLLRIFEEMLKFKQ